ncbi:thiamine phosphate synthase [Geomicrobium sp. JCM 19039]|uniref:thiamine phosphate synthase n=1 Tax=Geomicrobium sp. JCM 19039 TaxID=1460636 RepID=UPI002101CFF3|nr:thiamine phosphate synthase [Geomicrobium sp. JCM 19039]
MYAITGEELHPNREMLEVMEEVLLGGASALQLRDKSSPKYDLIQKGKALKRLANRFGVPFFMNDHLDVALAVDADGVHFGQGDFPLIEARKLLGNQKIIGISTHSIEQAQEAERNGANYIGVGPVFQTNTKTDAERAIGVSGFQEISSSVRIPTVAIGGINEQNASDIIRAGAKQLAVISGVVAKDNVKEAARYYTNLYDGERNNV